MRWIFTYNEAIKKHIEKVLKTKIKVEPQPWLHIAVKTVSKRNPWAGYVIYVWDTREIVKSGEYRSKTGKFETSNFTGVPGLRRAKDNRQPLKGGKGDVNKFFEFEVDKSAECDDVAGTESLQSTAKQVLRDVLETFENDGYDTPAIMYAETEGDLVDAGTRYYFDWLGDEIESDELDELERNDEFVSKVRDKMLKMAKKAIKYRQSDSGNESVAFGPTNR